MAYFDHRHAERSLETWTRARAHPKNGHVEPKPTVPHPWQFLMDRLGSFAAAWARGRKRHEIERMLEFDDAMLRDIGVSRDDVRQALTTDDPSAALTRSARDHRHKQRRSART